MAICHKILDPAVEVEAAALNCLQKAYSALDLEPYSPTITEDAARKCALQYVALGAFYNDGIAESKATDALGHASLCQPNLSQTTLDLSR